MKRILAVLFTLALALVGCGSDGSGGSGGSETITVYAAASLTDAFTEIGEKFEAENEGVEVRFSFGGSSELVAQIEQGAPADVFASADEKNMAELVDAGLEGGQPVDFATNTLQIATPAGNPAGITSLADLARTGVKLVVCAAEVPCGAAALAVAEAGGVRLDPVSEEQSVKDVLAKVVAGEADAGLVYVTDVKAAGDDVTGVVLPEAAKVLNVYPITTVEGSEHDRTARRFVEFVAGDVGRAVLASYGFTAPAP